MGILCYHTVDDQFRSRLSLTPAQFEEHCRWLVADREVVDLATALELADGRGRLPRGVVALTFDDGLEGLYRHAYPTLVRYGLPATVFMVGDTLTGAHPEVDWIDGTPPGVLRVMTSEQVLEMARDGISFGSHSSRHLDLTGLDPTACEADLRRSRRVLEEMLGEPVHVLAYPRGRHSTDVRVAAQRAGFRYGLSLPEGREPIGELAVPRVGVYAHNSLPALRIKSSRAFLPVRMGPAYPVARSVARAVRPRRSTTTPPAPTSEARGAVEDETEGEQGRAHVAYVMSRFPKISETFVLNEILELRRRGVHVDIHPLLRERQPVAHPEAEALTREAHFQPFLSWAIVGSNVHFLRYCPSVYLRLLWDVLRGTAGSLNFFVGAVGILPKTVHTARMMQRAGVEHVHCHFATHPAVAGMIVQRLTGIPFSFTAHGSDLHVDRRMLPQKVSEAAFVVAISDYNRRIILDACPPQDHPKVHVIHCGVDLSRFQAPGPAAPSASLRIVCVGTLHEVKGQQHLVDACAQLRDRGIAVTCRIIGEGPDRHALERQVRRVGVEGRVELLGPLARDRVVEELEHADVLVTPSVPTAGGKREGIPVVLMEAMAMERPVVASRLSGIPELVDHERSGLLVPPGDVTALADALQRLAGDRSLRDRLGRSGRETIQESFELSACVTRLSELMGVDSDAPSGRPALP